jgi:hypothetical protein
MSLGWIINGQTNAGYRIDDLDSSLEGVAMLKNPVAIVPDITNARKIAAVPKLIAACKAARVAFRATSAAVKDYSYELSLLNGAIAEAEKGGA